MLTLLSCGQGQNGLNIASLIAAFKLRVAADSGAYEAEACQVSTLTNLNSI